MPVHNVERSIRGELHIYRSEIRIGRHDQILLQLTRESRAIFYDAMVLRAQKADRVVDEKVSLSVFRKVSRRNEFGSRSGAYTVRGKLRQFFDFLSVWYFR